MRFLLLFFRQIFWVLTFYYYCCDRIANNTSGQYKRGTAIAIDVAFGNTAGCELSIYCSNKTALSVLLTKTCASYCVCIIPCPRRTSIRPWQYVPFSLIYESYTHTCPTRCRGTHVRRHRHHDGDPRSVRVYNDQRSSGETDARVRRAGGGVDGGGGEGVGG